MSWLQDMLHTWKERRIKYSVSLGKEAVLAASGLGR